LLLQGSHNDSRETTWCDERGPLPGLMMKHPRLCAPCPCRLTCRYAQYHLYDSERCHTLLATLLAKYSPDEGVDLLGDELLDTLAGGPLPTPPPRAAGTTPAAAERQRQAAAAAALAASLASEFSQHDDKPFTPHQQAAVDALLHQRVGLAVLSGGPGCGKTFVVQKLTRLLRAQGRTVHLSASTGAAAVRLSRFATTNHTAFNLPVYQQFGSRALRPVRSTDAHVQALQVADVFFIDEFSMMTSEHLMQVLITLWHASGEASIDEMLKHRLIILVGDHAQVRFGGQSRMHARLPTSCRWHSCRPVCAALPHALPCSYRRCAATNHPPELMKQRLKCAASAT
jgi:hypothetical protein